MSNADEQDVIQALARIIAQNADWLDGRTFQRLALHTARSYFEEGDLDDYGTFNDLRKAFEEAAKIAMEVVKDA
ncbi:hypothetical protein D3C84_790140 [compost metagenome]